MAPLSCPLTMNEPQEILNYQTPSQNGKPAFKEPSPNGVSPLGNRRVIFPSLYSNNHEGFPKAQEEKIHSSKNTPSPHARQHDDANSVSFPLRSPGLPPKSSRICDELGLEIRGISLDDSNSMVSPHLDMAKQKATVKTTSSTTPSPLSLHHKDTRTQLLNALSTFKLQSPGLPPKTSRVCDELGLEVPTMSLDSKTSAEPRLVSKSKAVNSMHFAPKPPAGVTRSSSGSKPSPQRRSRIDRSRINFTRPTTNRACNNRRPFSCPTSPCEVRPSILRPSKRGVSKKDSVPSLTLSEHDSSSSIETLPSSLEQSDFSPCKLTRSVSFDARVWVLEYERSKEELERTWFTAEELEHFRRETVARLVAHNTELLPTGTGFVVHRGSIPTKAVFAIPAMGAVEEDDEDDADESEIIDTANKEIQNVLVVDPHDMCAKLFTRDLQRMLPGVNVCTARSSEEARERMAEVKRFDIMIVEERLKLFRREALDQWKTTPQADQRHVSGSGFIKALAEEKAAGPPEDHCLFIAVSAHLDKDKHKMKANGADFIWAKPPPKMDEIVRDVLLKALLVKREKKALSDRLFGDIMGIP